MKKTKSSKTTPVGQDDLRAEYRFDYTQARPNRFAGKLAEQPTVVVLDDDVSAVFTSSRAVNDVLRAMIVAMKDARAK